MPLPHHSTGFFNQLMLIKSKHLISYSNHIRTVSIFEVFRRVVHACNLISALNSMSCVGFSFSINAICCAFKTNTFSTILVNIVRDQKSSILIVEQKIQKHQKIRKCGDMKAAGMNLRFWFFGSAAITL